MSRSLAANCGSLESLNTRVRCGCRPCLRQMRCTELTLMRWTLAIAAAVQCVASPGGSARVAATTRATTSGSRGGMRDGRVLSRNRPATPSVMKRSCQRHTAVLLVPVHRMISAVPQLSAVSNTIRARQTCFCGLFRSATMASRRIRSLAVIPCSRDNPEFRWMNDTEIVCDLIAVGAPLLWHFVAQEGQHRDAEIRSEER